MKKILSFAALSMLAASFVVGVRAFAQVPQVTISGSGSASVGTAVSGGATADSPVHSIISPEPIVRPGTGDSGFVQFNSLVVESVSGSNASAEIIAGNDNVYFNPVPLGSGSTNGSTGSGTVAPSAAARTCFSFQSSNDSSGKAIPCPQPPSVSSANIPATGSGSGSGSAVGSPAIMPSFASSYRIEVNSQTQLMLRDRSVASLNDFAKGDQINVFGYYNADGSVQAYLVRNTSKPVETQTMQLNNVTLISVSASTSPATLAVTQGYGNPCFGFNGSAKASIMCPMGVSSFSQNGATANVQPTPSMAPMWAMLRKFVVNVDARTIILDSNRKQISLSSLNLNDTLNVYGESDDNGQTITADIIRDLSIPPAETTIEGSVTQVNADGSFVIQTNNGQTLTVQSPVSIGDRVTLQGILNAAQNIVTQISHLTIGNAPTPEPVPTPIPMMRIQGSPYPTSTNGKPINY